LQLQGGEFIERERERERERETCRFNLNGHAWLWLCYHKCECRRWLSQEKQLQVAQTHNFGRWMGN